MRLPLTPVLFKLASSATLVLKKVKHLRPQSLHECSLRVDEMSNFDVLQFPEMEREAATLEAATLAAKPMTTVQRPKGVSTMKAWGELTVAAGIHKGFKFCQVPVSYLGQIRNRSVKSAWAVDLRNYMLAQELQDEECVRRPLNKEAGWVPAAGYNYPLNQQKKGTKTDKETMDSWEIDMNATEATQAKTTTLAKTTSSTSITTGTSKRELEPQEIPIPVEVDDNSEKIRFLQQKQEELWTQQAIVQRELARELETQGHM